MPFFKKSFNGSGYIVLNIIRACNIITLLAIVAASMVMLVKTFVVSKFFFFDGVSHVITGCLACKFCSPLPILNQLLTRTIVALVITEIGMFRRYIANNWPLLSPASGFITLGVLMIILGISILGNLNKTATSQESLGGTFWRLTIASGIVVSIMGVVNLFATYMFRNKDLDITARQVRAHGSTAPQKVYISPSTSRSSPRRSFHLNRRSASDTLPSYRTDNQPRYQPRNVSAPMPATSPVHKADDPVPVVNGIQRPDLAAHPAFQGQGF